MTAAAPALAADLDPKAPYPLPVGDPDVFETPPPARDGYGTADLQILNLGWSSLLPINGSATWEYDSSQFIHATSGNGWYCAGLDALPNGALLTTVGTYYSDQHAAQNPVIELGYGYGPGNWTDLKTITPDTWSGYTLQWFDLGLGHTVDQYANTYTLCFYFPIQDGTIMFRNFRVLYRLQVSPAPATATFNDLPTGHMFFQYVEALADSGITAGCGSGNFCPDSPLTRGQMAVFLAKALGLHYPAF